MKSKNDTPRLLILARRFLRCNKYCWLQVQKLAIRARSTEEELHDEKAETNLLLSSDRFHRRSWSRRSRAAGPRPSSSMQLQHQLTTRFSAAIDAVQMTKQAGGESQRGCWGRRRITARITAAIRNQHENCRGRRWKTTTLGRR